MGLPFRITAPLLLFTVLLHVSDAYRVVCVYTNWAQYRPDGGKFLPEDIDAQLCTHIIYVYAKLKGNKLEAMEWNDEDSRWSEGMYTRVNNLKKTNPELKTLLGVGGWMMGSKDFSRLAASRGSRRVYAQTTVKFLRDRGFDGLTIDWQHPTMRGGKPGDKENFSELLKELRNAFDMDGKTSGLPTLLLTAGVSASKQVMENAYEIDNITRFTDFLNVMAYDLHGSWDNFTGHPSQLYQRKDELGPSSEINVDTIMKMWISKSGDRSKLNLGISTYGRTFTLKHPNHNGYEVPSTGPGTQGEFTQQPGMLAHYERCNRYFDATHVWDDTSKASYWFQGDQWIAGEDTESVKAKVIWTKCNLIGGIMFNSLDMDDFQGFYCSGQLYPLLNTIQNVLISVIRPEQCLQQKTQRNTNLPPGVTTTSLTSSTTADMTTFDPSLYYDFDLNMTDLTTTTASLSSLHGGTAATLMHTPDPLFANMSSTQNNIVEHIGGKVIGSSEGIVQGQTNDIIGKKDMTAAMPTSAPVGIENIFRDILAGIEAHNNNNINNNNNNNNKKNNSQIWDSLENSQKGKTIQNSDILAGNAKTKIPTHSLLEVILNIMAKNQKEDVLTKPNEQGVVFSKERTMATKQQAPQERRQVLPNADPDFAAILFPKRKSQVRIVNGNKTL